MSAYSSLITGHAALKFYARLGETSGTAATDTAGGANGTYTGTAGALTLGVAGALVNDTNKAVTFADAGGTYSPLTFPDANAIDLGDTFSIEGWMKHGAMGAGAETAANKGTNAYELRLNTSGQPELRKSGVVGNPIAYVARSSVSVVDSAYHHVVVTKTGATTKVYVDGVDVTSAGTNQTLSDTANVLRVAHISTTTQRFIGTLDELALYNAVLTPTEVLEHYLVGKGYSGAISVSGTGSVAATGVRGKVGAASIAGAGTVAAAGTRTVLGAASVAGAGTVSATGRKATTGAGSVAGAGTIAAQGVRTVQGAASVAGAGTVAVTSTRLGIYGASAVTGAGSLAGGGVRTTFAAASISGAGTVSAAGSRTVLGAAALAGSGAVSATGARGRTGAASVGGAGSVSATGSRVTSGAASITGVGSIAATGSRATVGAAVVSGTGTITVTVRLGSIDSSGSTETPEGELSVRRTGSATGGVVVNEAAGLVRSSG